MIYLDEQGLGEIRKTDSIKLRKDGSFILKDRIDRHVKEEARGIRLSDRAKVLIISVIDDPVDIARAFQEGNCDAYLSKPFGERDLFAQLAKIGLYPPEKEEDDFDND